MAILGKGEGENIGKEREREAECCGKPVNASRT